jgi:hypothetical protein
VNEIPDRQNALNAFAGKFLVDDHKDKRESPNGHANGHTPGLPSDEQVLAKLRADKRAPEFANLFDHGDLSGHEGDESRADYRLLRLMYFYTQDHAQLERLFDQSVLGQRPKWRRRDDYRWRTIAAAISKGGATYSWPSSSSSPLGDSDDDDGAFVDDESLRLTSLASVDRPPDERPVVVEGMIPQRFPAILYGDGGTAKSLLAASMLLDVARGAERWMGHRIKQHGPVIYLDFELDLEEQARRIYQLAEGVGLQSLPENFYYLSGGDHPAGVVLKRTLGFAKDCGAVLVLLDSLGFALEGDAEASRDVLRFRREYIKPFETAGITLLIVDHQSKILAGEGYHQKSPFGSVYKSNSCRSVIQVGVEDQQDGELTVYFRHKKANFGSKLDPFEAKLTFHKSKVEITHRALSSEEIATEGSLNTTQKIRRLLKDGPMYPNELAEKIGATEGTIKNSLTKLRKGGEIEDTGEVSESGAHEVRLRQAPSSSSHTPSDNDDDDGGGGGDDTRRVGEEF